MGNNTQRQHPAEPRDVLKDQCINQTRSQRLREATGNRAVMHEPNGGNQPDRARGELAVKKRVFTYFIMTKI